MTEENWGRLAEFVAQRMNELDLTQAQIQQRGGPSPAKVREVTSRRTTTMSPSKRRDLERALDWRSGSIDAILAGGDPTAAETGLRNLDDDLTRLTVEIERLGRLDPTDETAQLQRQALQERLAALGAERDLLRAMARRSTEAQRMARLSKLVDLWRLARPLTNPEVMLATGSIDDLTDAAVELAREVSTFTENAVGGYSRMQDLAKARVERIDQQTGQQTIFDEYGDDSEGDLDVSPVAYLPHWGKSEPPPTEIDEKAAASTRRKRSDEEDDGDFSN